jgi:hypothetical protein
LPDLDAVAGGEGVAEDALVIDPGAVGAVAVVEDVAIVLGHDDGVVAGDEELAAEADLVLRVPADGEAFGWDGEAALAEGAGLGKEVG